MHEIVVREKYERLTKLLIERELTITTMESITSGQIASLITDVEGASKVLKGAFVTYSNEAKELQGVPAEVIEQYGVYSAETAREMAKACQRVYGTDVAVGITGSAGNVDPNNADSVPGQVYFSIAFDKELYDVFFEMDKQPSRLAYKLYAAEQVVDYLLMLLK